MKLSDFDYDLPKELIAQEALPKRSDARLLVLNRNSGEIQHKHFRDLPELLNSDDVLVLNNSKVLPARFFGKKETGGIMEVLLLNEIVPHPTLPLEGGGRGRGCGQTWEALLKPSGRIKNGQIILFEGGKFAAHVIDAPRDNSGLRLLQFAEGIDVQAQMNRIGRIPLPPYIDREDLPIDRELYQTVYAAKPGSVASPTAGLHFDNSLLAQIEKKGTEIAHVTLHVGYGTFQPVAEEDLAQHKIHSEYFEIPEETAEKINMAKTDGRRIVACGTTSIRTLEAAVIDHLPSEVEAKNGATNLFIFPPYEFKIVDAIITNFHLPRTTLLMLVAAFCGKENMDQAYKEAIREKYRFYSYGDAMMII